MTNIVMASSHLVFCNHFTFHVQKDGLCYKTVLPPCLWLYNSLFHEATVARLEGEQRRSSAAPRTTPICLADYVACCSEYWYSGTSMFTGKAGSGLFTTLYS